VDGLRGPQIFKSPEWVAWNGSPVDIIVDMEQTEPYGSVTVGCISDKPSYVFLPARLAVAVSEDGENYTEVAVQEYEVEGRESPDILKDFTLTFPETSARYLKITAVPVQSIPDWHYAAGRRTFVFFDEIVVL
jgi:hexosaminidase